MSAKPSVWLTIWAELRANRSAQLAIAVLALLVIVSVAAPLLSFHDPFTLNLESGRFLPPFFADG